MARANISSLVAGKFPAVLTCGRAGIFPFAFALLTNASGVGKASIKAQAAGMVQSSNASKAAG